MLFFIISKEARRKKDYSSILDPLFIQDKAWDHRDIALIAWNEVPGFSTPEKFLAQMHAVALRDPVCVEMMRACEADYGLRFYTTNDKKALHISYSVFYYWIHPLIGNLGNSPNMRTPDVNEKLKQWGAFVDKETITAMRDLLGHLYQRGIPMQLLRAARDQAKLHHNIVDATRSFIGEITCAPTKRLEKLLALRLCRSPKLWAAQSALIALYWDKRRVALEKAAFNNFGAMEYCRYYFQACLPAKGDEAVHLLRALVATAVGLDKLKLKKSERDLVEELLRLDKRQPTTSHLVIWTKLPPQIRCAVLINDFRKLDTTVAARLPKQTAMCFVEPFPMKSRKRLYRDFAPHISTVEDRIKDHVPTRSHNQLHFAFGFTRDEYAPTVITYRLNLCPLWAGPSNHTVGGIAHWIAALGDESPADLAMTVASSLGALWRLYYDKRISPDHTMTEAFEATFNSTVTRDRSAMVTCVISPVKKTLEAFDLLRLCSVNFGDFRAVDPILVFRHLRHWASSDYSDLKRLINEERQLLTRDGFWVPQWSHQSTVQIGSELRLTRSASPPRISTDVFGFSRPLALVAEFLTAPDDSDIEDAFKFEAWKGGALALVRQRLSWQ